MGSVLHYGQCLFEGLKVRCLSMLPRWSHPLINIQAFECRDGAVRLFQPDYLNVKRLNRGCVRLSMPTVSEDMFMAAIRRVIKDNLDYIPPYGSGLF